jgi:hypothetical protein
MHIQPDRHAGPASQMVGAARTEGDHKGLHGSDISVGAGGVVGVATGYRRNGLASGHDRRNWADGRVNESMVEASGWHLTRHKVPLTAENDRCWSGRRWLMA